MVDGDTYYSPECPPLPGDVIFIRDENNILVEHNVDSVNGDAIRIFFGVEYVDIRWDGLRFERGCRTDFTPFYTDPLE